jgi:hypothetical protein
MDPQALHDGLQLPRTPALERDVEIGDLEMPRERFWNRCAQVGAFRVDELSVISYQLLALG